jgi:hypothetical protein
MVEPNLSVYTASLSASNSLLVVSVGLFFISVLALGLIFCLRRDLYFLAIASSFAAAGALFGSSLFKIRIDPILVLSLYVVMSTALTAQIARVSKLLLPTTTTLLLSCIALAALAGASYYTFFVMPNSVVAKASVLAVVAAIGIRWILFLRLVGVRSDLLTPTEFLQLGAFLSFFLATAVAVK